MRFSRPCWHCRAYAGLTGQGSAAVCRDRSGAVSVRTNPEQGCSFWEREPGADDEPGPPAGWSGGSQGVEWRTGHMPSAERPRRHA